MNQPETSNATSDKAQKRRWFILLLVIGLAATGLCIYLSVINLSRPYIGATLKFENQQWVVLSVEESGLAHAEDVKQGDAVISVNGQEPADFPQEHIDREVYASQIVTELVVDRQNGAGTVELSVDDSSILPDTRLEAVILSIISFLFLAISFFVFIKKGVKRYSTVFYLANMAVGLAFVAVAARERNLFLSFELQIIILIILPWLVAHLFWVFPARKNWLPRLPRAEYPLVPSYLCDKSGIRVDLCSDFSFPQLHHGHRYKNKAANKDNLYGHVAGHTATTAACRATRCN